jgi:hypothetical protein
MTSIHCFFVVEPRAVGPHTLVEDNAFLDADVRLRVGLLSVLGDTIVNAYVPLQFGKEMWDALEERYRVSDVGSELYVMEQFHDYWMVDDHSVVEQDHEIHALVKDLEMRGYELPDKFVAGCMIAKLPPSWTEFATSLKHKRREFDVTQLIGTLDVEDKAREKDVKGKKVAENGSSAHVVQKNRPKPQKKKNQQDVKRKNTTSFKKKKKDMEKGNYFTCGKTGHFAMDCPDAKWKPNQKKSVNMVEVEGGTSRYGNSLHIVFQFLIYLIGGLIQEPIYIYVLINPCFLLIRSGGLPPC